jgi:hypothetical protein
MKKYIISTIMLLIPLVSSANNEALDYLNDLRQKAGLTPLIKNTALDNAAQNHANYLKEEGSSGHQETNTNNTHYTGEWVWDRVNHLNYDYSAIGENISANEDSWIDSIDGLFQAIYHRLGFLSFDFEHIGMGMVNSENYGNIHVYNMATKKPNYSTDIQVQNSSIVLWPPKDYEQTQPAFFNTESPDPLPECPYGGPSGNPITIQFNPSKSGDIEFVSFSLRDKYGDLVKTKRVTTYLNDKEFALFPIDRLDWDNIYTAEFHYKENGEDKSLKWNFKTRKLDNSILYVDSQAKKYDVAKGSTYALYIKPQDCNDVNNGYGYDPTKLSLSTIDKNTYEMKVKADVGSNFSIKLQNGKEYNFHTFTKEIKSLTFSDRSSNSVTLNWEHEPSGEESGYKIFRDDKLIATVDIDTKSYTDTNLSPNTTYKYTVKVTNDATPNY